MALVTGSVFSGFRVTGLIAEGHMGAVYSAEEVSTGKQRALKLIHPHVVVPGSDPAAFVASVRRGAELDPEHFVQVVNAGVDVSTGTAWLAMQLLRGENSATRVMRRGALSSPLLEELFSQVCAALGRAHAQGLWHGDMKPENVFLASARRVGMAFSINILDFGIAPFVQTGESYWKAPEQLRGERAGAPSDAWSLGLVAFFALTGRSYWDAPRNGAPAGGSSNGPSATQAAQLLGVPLPVAPTFDAWFARCLHPDPNRRFDSAEALMKALRQSLAGLPIDLGRTRARVPLLGKSMPGAPSDRPSAMDFSASGGAERHSAIPRSPAAPGQASSWPAQRTKPGRSALPIALLVGGLFLLGAMGIVGAIVVFVLMR